jgi:hypothetical protein
VEPLDPPGLGEEGAGILGVQARLDRMPLRLDPLCRKRLSRRDAELLGDEVEAGHELGHRVLDLDPAVQLEEEEVVSVEDELDRARAPVADRAAEGDRGLEQRGSPACGEPGSRRLLEHLLVASLHGAVALPERDDVPVRVGEQLHLHVARPLQVALAVERPVAEGAGRLPSRGCERRFQLCGRAHDAHPAPASTRGRLDQEREPDLLLRPVREHGDARLARDALGRELVPAQAQGVRRRPDPGQPGGLDRLGEVGALGQEPVARVDRVGAGGERGADVLLGVEVARDLDHLVGGAGVQGAAVVGRDDGHGPDPEPAAGAEDADRDLAAIRHQQPTDRHAAELRGETASGAAPLRGGEVTIGIEETTRRPA